MKTRIDPLSCKFVNSAVEAEYNAHISQSNNSSQIIALFAGALIFALFAVLDLMALEEPGPIVLIRLLAAVGCAIVAILLRYKSVAKYHAWIIPAMVVSGGAIVNIAVWREPDLEATYFVGLITMAIFATFLQRISFLSSVLTISIMFVGYLIAISNKIGLDPERLIINIFFLVTMNSCCLLGSYILENFRRNEFVQTRMIEDQNKQLEKVLFNTQLDNKRKVAALNMLLHLIRTPVHQISGFSDIVLMKLREEDVDHDSTNEIIDSAEYIKSASDELRHGVSKLLTYHQLDEIERDLKIEEIHLGEILNDAISLIDEDIHVSISRSVKKIKSDNRLIKLAVTNLINNIKDNDGSISRLDIEVSREGDDIKLSFKDDGPGIDSETLERTTKPLIEIDNYLNGCMEDLAMGLRTISRAMEIAGGKLDYKYADGAMFTLSFPEKQPSETVSIPEIAA